MRERKQMRAEQLEFCFEHAGRARLFGGFERIRTDEFRALIAMMRARGAERAHLDQAHRKTICSQLQGSFASCKTASDDVNTFFHAIRVLHNTSAITSVRKSFYETLMFKLRQLDHEPSKALFAQRRTDIIFLHERIDRELLCLECRKEQRCFR